MDKPATFAEITEETIQDWKAKYGAGALSQVTIESQDTEFNFVVRKPPRPVVEAISAAKEPNAANKILIANCVLGGDMHALENDGSVFISIVEQIGVLMSKAKATVKKL